MKSIIFYIWCKWSSATIHLPTTNSLNYSFDTDSKLAIEESHSIILDLYEPPSSHATLWKFLWKWMKAIRHVVGKEKGMGWFSFIHTKLSYHLFITMFDWFHIHIYFIGKVIILFMFPQDVVILRSLLTIEKEGMNVIW